MKFDLYRSIDSVQEYVLIAQDRPHVLHYVRQPNQTWVLSEHSGITESLALPSIDCSILFAEIYAKVQFETPPETDSTPYPIRSSP